MRAGKDVFGNLGPSWCPPTPSSGGGSNTTAGGENFFSATPSFSPCEKTESDPARVDSASSASSTNRSRRIKRLILSFRLPVASKTANQRAMQRKRKARESRVGLYTDNSLFKSSTC